MRLIDADELLDHLYNGVEYDRTVSDGIKKTDENIYAYKCGWNEALKSASKWSPTVDAVPLEDYKSMEQTVNKLTKAIADAESVKHGHWTIEDIITYKNSYGITLYEPLYKCSCCGRVTESYVRGDEPIMPEDADFPKFCGNCGAKMDKEAT